jgi:hypothetical protein
MECGVTAARQSIPASESHVKDTGLAGSKFQEFHSQTGSRV